MRPGAHVHSFCSELQVGECYETLSGARAKEDCHSGGGEIFATEDGEGKKMAVFEVMCVPLRYTRKLGNMMSSIRHRKDHHVKVCKKAVHFWRKRLSYGYALFHVNYEGNGIISTSHP